MRVVVCCNCLFYHFAVQLSFKPITRMHIRNDFWLGRTTLSKREPHLLLDRTGGFGLDRTYWEAWELFWLAGMGALLIGARCWYARRGRQGSAGEGRRGERRWRDGGGIPGGDAKKKLLGWAPNGRDGRERRSMFAGWQVRVISSKFLGKIYSWLVEEPFWRGRTGFFKTILNPYVRISLKNTRIRRLLRIPNKVLEFTKQILRYIILFII